MNDNAVRDLAKRAGIAVRWTDYAGKQRQVSIDSLRRILSALGLPCETSGDLSHSRKLLDSPRMPALVTATIGEPIDLPVATTADPPSELIYENGEREKLALRSTANGVRLSSITAPGYHAVMIGETRVAVAIAPPRCLGIEDIAPGARIGGLAAQTYGLRSEGDCGIGDMTGVAALARSAASLKVDALALSPWHALFTADPGHFSPYSPSNRLFYNPLLADPADVFGLERTERARVAVDASGIEHQSEARSLIDWTTSGRVKLSVFRCLFDDFCQTDLAVGSATTAVAADFARFRAVRGLALQHHAMFETLHAARLQDDPKALNWQTWPAQWRDPGSAAVQSFAEKTQQEILFHTFLQWIADRSFAATQQTAKQTGMRIGLISDLAVGMSGSGSQAWANQADILGGLEIGAPPDLFNANGQNWDLTTFSPRALFNNGYEIFIATLRACMRHAGGVRIDHAMGLMRLWVTPRGASPHDGAYLTYPLDDLLRLTALESHRHRAIVIGEDLGTVPAGFRDRLEQAGIFGMRVLWFERQKTGDFIDPNRWHPDIVAMTSTHDLPTVAAWWRGADLVMREKCGLPGGTGETERLARRKDRDALWAAFAAAGVADAEMPRADETSWIADAATKFIAMTPSRLALLPLEDALALQEQPNVPGTIDEHPNWRRRYDRDAGTLLDPPDVRRRVEALTARGIT